MPCEVYAAFFRRLERRSTIRSRFFGFTVVQLVFMTTPVMLAASLHVFPELLVRFPPGVLLLQALGRNGLCPLEKSLSAYGDIQRMNRETVRLIEASEHDPPDASGLVRWTTPKGAFWAPSGTSVPFLLSEQEAGVYGTHEGLLRRGDVVLDCGANVGAFTREALLAGASLVVAIEPSERNITCLRRTFAAEIEQGRVVVCPKGVWHEEDELTMWVYPNSALDSFVMNARAEGDQPPEAVEFPVTTLDRIVKQYQLSRVDFIKMDIEGAEGNALAGAVGTLRRYHPRLAIATENLQQDQYKIRDFITSISDDYRMRCNRCTPQGVYEIRPDVLLFD